MWKLLDSVLSFLSGEIFLRQRANGGTAILARSLWVAVVLYSAAVALRALLETGFGTQLNTPVIRRVIIDTMPWAGAIFAAAYAGLYTRFSGQWSYLAGVYYQYMSTRAQAPVGTDPERARIYDAWEAAIVEDAEDLHLATKRSYAHLLQEILADANVRRTFVETAAGGQARLDGLLAKLECVTRRSLEEVARLQEQRNASREHIALHDSSASP